MQRQWRRPKHRDQTGERIEHQMWLICIENRLCCVGPVQHSTHRRQRRIYDMGRNDQVGRIVHVKGFDDIENRRKNPKGCDDDRDGLPVTRRAFHYVLFHV